MAPETGGRFVPTPILLWRFGGTQFKAALK
jgi:hypothetical protein